MAEATRVLKRGWSAIDGADVTKGFTLMTWNQLADGLAQDGGFVVPDEILLWEYRKPLILAEIDAVQPDILCMQEVNHPEDIAVHLPEYSMLLAPKLASSAVSSGVPPDGCAMFINRKRFAVEDIRIIYYKDSIGGGLSNQNAIVALLKDKATSKRIIIATTHLKAKKDEPMRVDQIQQLLRHLSKFQSKHDPSASTVPVVLCGDFNSPPDGQVYSIISRHSLNLCSVYNSCYPSSCSKADVPVMGESEFTTWKFRSGGMEKKSTIDFIFHSLPSTVTAVGKYDLPSAADIGPAALPSDSYASDHLSLAARFKWV